MEALSRRISQGSSPSKQAAAATISTDAERLIRLSEQLHANPETGWEEHSSSRWVAEALAESGYDVTPAYLCLETAFLATIGLSGFVTVFPCANPKLVASVNFDAGATTSNAVIAPVSASGTVCFTSLVPTDLIVDINGWFVKAG